jgi:hypothetical protein
MIVSDGWPSLLNETRVALGIKVWYVSTLTARKGLAKDFIGSKRCHQLHREFYERQPDKIPRRPPYRSKRNALDVEPDDELPSR